MIIHYLYKLLILTIVLKFDAISDTTKYFYEKSLIHIKYKTFIWISKKMANILIEE